MDRKAFLFVTCQVGAEAAVKHELAQTCPDFRFAYSRPGFLTFKLPAECRLPADFELPSAFARAYGFSLGKAVGGEPDDLAAQVWQIWGPRPVRAIHVWQRDTAAPGQGGFEPGLTPMAIAARQAILRHAPRPDLLPPENLSQNVSAVSGARGPQVGSGIGSKIEVPRAEARAGQLVMDCIVVEADQWWVGWHRVRSQASRWPGGMMPLELPADAVSRAWLKMEEALRWSELPIEAGARCAEIGSAPGGASQSLLRRGVELVGIDPAEMHPTVLAHPHFTHLRRRARDVRRREFRKIRWLTADMNVAPQYTLDVVESIVTHHEVNVRGLLLTLKLFQWKMAEQLPRYLERIRGWGYNLVRARQLQHNRQEVCVAAIQRPFRRKGAGKRPPENTQT